MHLQFEKPEAKDSMLEKAANPVCQAVANCSSAIKLPPHQLPYLLNRSAQKDMVHTFNMYISCYLMRIPRPIVRPDVESPAARELMWNDPSDRCNWFLNWIRYWRGVEFFPNKQWRTGFYYTKLSVERFFQTNNLTLLVRAHECVKKGFKFHFNRKVDSFLQF